MGFWKGPSEASEISVVSVCFFLRQKVSKWVSVLVFFLLECVTLFCIYSSFIKQF